MSWIEQIPWWVAFLLSIGGALVTTFAPSLINPKWHPTLFYLGLFIIAFAASIGLAKVPFLRNLAHSGHLKNVSLVAFFILVVTSTLHFSFPKKKTPSLLLLPPTQTYQLIWDPLKSLQIITSPSDKTAEVEAGYRLPIFRLKNLSKEVARDIKVEWLIKEDFLEEKVAKSERLKKYKTSIQNNTVSMKKTEDGKTERWTTFISFDEANSYEYLSPQIDNESYMGINMPSRVYGVLEILFVAEMPSNAGMFDSVSKNLNIKIAYNENGENIKNEYTVNATARSLKPLSNGIVKIPIDGEMREPPEIMAEVKFNVTR